MEDSRYLPEPKKPRVASLGELIVKLGSGAAGAGVTAASGDPFAGVGTSVAADQAGKGLVAALLHRGDNNASITMRHAARRFEERKEAGEQPRVDGFKGASATEAVAATIKAASNSVEHRKAHLIGSLLASAEYEKDLPVSDLLRFLRLLEDLSWRQLLALASFCDEDRQADRILIAAGGSKDVRQIRPVLEAELADLTEVHGLIGLITPDGGVAKPSAVMGGGPITAASLDKVGPSGFGQTLYRLAEIKREITPEDLSEFIHAEILDA